MDLIDIKINEKLTILNETKFEDLDETSKNRLREIEVTFCRINEKSEAVYKDLKLLKPNFVMLADYLSFSKRTIYYHDILEKYINYSIDIYPDYFNNSMFEKLREELFNLEHRYFEIADKIIDKFNLSVEINSLNETIADLSNQNKILATLIDEKNAEIKKMKEKKSLTILDDYKKKER